MKYIFKYTILNFYCEDNKKLSEKQLVLTLKGVGFQDIDKCQMLIQMSRGCIDQLKSKIGKESPQKNLQIIRAHFQTYVKANAEQLCQIWDSQKYRVSAKILEDCTGSCQRFDNINWQLKNRISSKSGNNQQISSAIQISTKSLGATKKTCFELNNKSLQMLYRTLASASEFLDKNLN